MNTKEDYATQTAKHVARMSHPGYGFPETVRKNVQPKPVTVRYLWTYRLCMWFGPAGICWGIAALFRETQEYLITLGAMWALLFPLALLMQRR